MRFLAVLAAFFVLALLLLDEIARTVSGDSVNWNVFPASQAVWSGVAPDSVNWNSFDVDEEGRVTATGWMTWAG